MSDSIQKPTPPKAPDRSEGCRFYPREVDEVAAWCQRYPREAAFRALSAEDDYAYAVSELKKKQDELNQANARIHAYENPVSPEGLVPAAAHDGGEIKKQLDTSRKRIIELEQLSERRLRVRNRLIAERNAANDRIRDLENQVTALEAPQAPGPARSMVAAMGDSRHPYHALATALEAAFLQAAEGKGKERHANDLPFTDQKMQRIAQGQGHPGGLIYQVCKKAQESEGMGTEAAVRELCGVIVYAAGAIIFREQQP